MQKIIPGVLNPILILQYFEIFALKIEKQQEKKLPLQLTPLGGAPSQAGRTDRLSDVIAVISR